MGTTLRWNAVKAKAAAPKRSVGGRVSKCAVSFGSARQNVPVNFFYVYILESETDPKCYYTGFTEDLSARLKKHNAGGVPHSAKHRPWKIKTAVAFGNRERALEFERYLKTASGRAFAKTRL